MNKAKRFRERIKVDSENYYIMYDENKSKIGRINSNYEKLQNQWLKGVSVFVITDDGKLLLEKRTSSTKITPNQIDLCSGHRDNEEKGKITAYREIKEELGIKRKKIKKIKKVKKELPLIFNGNRKFYIQFYVAIIKKYKKQLKIQKSEVGNIEEVPIEQGFELIRQGKTKFPYKGNEEEFEKIFAKIEKFYEKNFYNKQEENEIEL